jgi:hypothetical protein
VSADPPSGAVTVPSQLQLRTPNKLGSALAGIAAATAAPSAIAALNSTFVITNHSP